MSRNVECCFEFDRILDSARTAYQWDASDMVEWAANAASVLGVDDIGSLSKGRAVALRVDREHAGARYDGITGDPHAAREVELRYSLHYRFSPDGRRGRSALWVEDSGVCFTDADGRAVRAQGTLRVIDDRREKEERLVSRQP